MFRILGLMLVLTIPVYPMGMDVEQIPARIGGDMVGLMGPGPEGIFQNQWFGPAMLGLTALIALDSTTTDYYERSIKPSLAPVGLKNWQTNADPDNTLFEFIKLCYGYSQWTNDIALSRFSVDAGQAVLDSWLMSQSVKAIVGRVRPNYTQNPLEFRHDSLSPDSKSTSFFSGHATAYSAFFSVLGKHTQQPLWCDLGFVVTYFCLLTDHNHWVSDMVVGYWMGQAIGEYVYNQNRTKEVSGQWFIYPTFVPGEGTYLISIGATRSFR